MITRNRQTPKGATLREAIALFLAACLPFGAAPPAGAGDVPPEHWGASAVAFVSEQRDWMPAPGGAFRPDALLARRELARALARAFAPEAQPDPATRFEDLPSEDADFASAAVVASKGWLLARKGNFLPDGTVSKSTLNRALVLALGLRAEVAGLDAIATADGTRLVHRRDFAPLVLASQLRLQYNYPTPNEAPELLPGTAVRRIDGAYALWRAAAARGTPRIAALKPYRSVTLPVMAPDVRATIEFALTYVGYPYVYAGEWFRRTPDPYCCGTQPVGGFDCSGWVWWVLRARANGWDNTKFRPYAGWALPERASYLMARGTSARLAYESVQPLDLLFYDSDSSEKDGTDWESVDHVAIALGGDWMIHSSGNRAGVTIDPLTDGWWRKHFRWARRVKPAA